MFLEDGFKDLGITFDGEDNALSFDAIASFRINGKDMPFFRERKTYRKNAVCSDFDRPAAYADLNARIGFTMYDEIGVDPKFKISSGFLHPGALLGGSETRKERLGH